MKLTALRVTEESAAFVKQTARQRGTAESEIWRELIERGIRRSDEVLGKLDSLSKLVVQSLCMGQRVAQHVEPELVEKARNDARLLIARMTSREDT